MGQIQTSDGTLTIQLRGGSANEGWFTWQGDDLEIEDWPEGSNVRWRGSGKAFDLAGDADVREQGSGSAFDIATERD